MRSNRFPGPFTRGLLGPALVVALSLAAHVHAAPPKVHQATPNDADTDVDPALKSITIVFDQDMAPVGFSVCGGGPSFPAITAKPTWSNPRTAVIPVKLEPAHSYSISINCASAQNFRSAAADEPAVITPIRFRTAALGQHTPAPTPEQTAASIEALRAAIHDRYSYARRLNLDWDALIDNTKPAIPANATRGQFVRAILPLLAQAKDPHVGVMVGDLRFGTYSPDIDVNADLSRLPMFVPEWRKHNDVVSTGRFSDGVGYILINSWPGDRNLLAAAHDMLDQLADAPGVIIDVRLNGGGNELTAKDVASRFIDAPSVYSRSRSRDASAPTGFTQMTDRTIEPPPEAKRFKGKVAVLQGAACMSSNESFLLMMAQSPRCTRIGATSFGSSGNPKPIELPNGVTLVLPSWQDFAPDGTPVEGRGIDPDIKFEPIHPTPRDFDPCINAALRFIRGEK